MCRTLLGGMWLSGFQMFVLFEVVIKEPTFPLSHTPTSNVRYIAFSMRKNTLLTLSKARYISHLGHTPNTAEPHAFKQGEVHCLAMTT